jgi:sugar-specific transcriptional regulator TrmB
LNRDVVETINAHLKAKFQNKIRDNIALAEAPARPYLRYNAKSNGAEDYMALAKEIINESKHSKTCYLVNIKKINKVMAKKVFRWINSLLETNQAEKAAEPKEPKGKREITKTSQKKELTLEKC